MLERGEAMDGFNDIDNDERVFKSNIRFNKKKKSCRRKAIAFGVAYVTLAAFSGIVTAIALAYNEDTFYKIYGMEQSSNNSILNLSSQDENIKNNHSTKQATQSVVSIINVKNKDNIITESNSGVGIIIKKEGYIITNYHLIQDASNIKVKLFNNQVYEGKLIGIEKTYDLALVKINAENLIPLKLGDSSQAKNEDEVVVIGNHDGRQYGEYVQQSTVISINEVSLFLNKDARLTTSLNVFKISKPPNNINSGAALCNSKGELIGVSNISINYSKGNMEDTYYISSNDLSSILNDMMNGENHLIATLGINGEEAIPRDSDGVEGFYIRDVKKGSDAYNAGLRPTDIIVEINHNPIKSVDDINKILIGNKDGENIECVIFKNGAYRTINMMIKQEKIK